MLNNKDTGKFIVNYSNNPTCSSFTIGGSNSNTVIWKFTHLGTNRYLIESVQSPGYYLKNNGSNATVSQLNSGTNVDSAFIWLISKLSSGNYIANMTSSGEVHLNSTEGSSSLRVNSLGTAGGVVWRIEKLSDYYPSGQLTSMSVTSKSIDKTETYTLSVDGISGKTWVDNSDFTLSVT